jgi:hypothetical protein
MERHSTGRFKGYPRALTYARNWGVICRQLFPVSIGLSVSLRLSGDRSESTAGKRYRCWSNASSQQRLCTRGILASPPCKPEGKQAPASSSTASPSHLERFLDGSLRVPGSRRPATANGASAAGPLMAPALPRANVRDRVVSRWAAFDAANAIADVAEGD